jgi:hypothetical protein
MASNSGCEVCTLSWNLGSGLVRRQIPLAGVDCRTLLPMDPCMAMRQGRSHAQSSARSVKHIAVQGALTAANTVCTWQWRCTLPCERLCPLCLPLSCMLPATRSHSCTAKCRIQTPNLAICICLARATATRRRVCGQRAATIHQDARASPSKSNRQM